MSLNLTPISRQSTHNRGISRTVRSKLRSMCRSKLRSTSRTVRSKTRSISRSIHTTSRSDHLQIRPRSHSRSA